MCRRFLTQLAVFFLLIGLLGGLVSHAMRKTAVIDNAAAVLETDVKPGTLYAIPDSLELPENMLAVVVGGAVITDSADTLLAKMLAAEMDAGYAPEALKAQAVADRSTVSYYNAQRIAPAVELGSPDEAHTAAVAAVSGQMIYEGDSVVYAPSCPSTAGRTNAAREMIDSIQPHLVSVESKYDSEGSDWDAENRISVTDLYNILTDAGFVISSEQPPESWISILSLTDGGYVKNMAVCGQTSLTVDGKEEPLTGSIFSSLLPSPLPSTCFAVSLDGDAFVFTTRGRGNGVGLSRQGANLYALRENLSYTDILTHYFTGVTVH